MKRARKGKTTAPRPRIDKAASIDQLREPAGILAAMASPEKAAKCADSIDGWFNGFYAVRNLGRSLVTEAVASMDRDPDRGIAMVNAYVALLAADGRARA